jgi:hypothetical protein
VLPFAAGLLQGPALAAALAGIGMGAPAALAAPSFLLGVEIGMLAVISVAALALILPFGGRPWYGRAVVLPGSLAVAAVAAYLALAGLGPAV